MNSSSEPYTPMTSTPDTVHVEEKLDLGTIFVSGTVALVAVLLFILIWTKRIQGFRFRSKDREVSVGDPSYKGPERRASVCGEVDMKAIQVTQLVARRRAEAHDSAWSQQKAYADEVEDIFWPILDRRGVDHWQIETAWARLHRVLASTADQNHILDFVRGDEVDPDYLNDKVSIFRRRYDKLLARTECILPPFQIIEDQIRALLAETLIRFGHFAEDEERDLTLFVDAIKNTTDNLNLREIIDTVAKRSQEA